MQRPPDPLRGVFAVGVTFRTAPEPLRDRLAVAPDAEAEVLAALKAQGLAEVLLLSTCDRVEVLGVAEDSAAAARRAADLLATRAGLPPGALQDFALQALGRDAAQHLFAIAASLESQVVGEPQVLGQVKEAERRAEAAGVLGPTLRTTLAAAYSAAKRVRRETKLGERPVSLAAAALKMARRLHGDLSERQLLLLGLGEIGELLAWEFHDVGVKHITVAHDSPARAAATAQRLRGHHAALSELPALLAQADIVVAAVGAGRLLLDKALVRVALKARRQRPMLILDTVLPRDVAEEVQSLDSAFVFSLDDLERLAAEGKAEREAAARGAWHLLSEELAAFLRDRAARDVAPAITDLRRAAESLRRDVLSDRRLDAEAATQLLLKRLLHAPSSALREAASEGDQTELERALRRLFDLKEGEV